MTAEGRIQSAARWIRGAYGLMASAVGKTDVGYDKSRWQRIGDATRAVEYAVKGLAFAVDGRVGQRHNTRELAFHLLARGENVGIEDLDRMKLDKGREFNAYAEFEEPDFEDVDENRTAEILRAAMRIVSNCERRVRALARQYNVPANLAPRTGSSWQPPEDVRDSLLTPRDDTRPAKQTMPSEQDRGAPPAGAGRPDQPAPKTSPRIGDPPPNPATPPRPARDAAAEQGQSQQRSGQER